MRHFPTFAMIFTLAFAAGCASEPPPKAPIASDQSSYQPAEYVEMSFDGKTEAQTTPKPVAAPNAQTTDKPNVATQGKRGLFGIANKTKD